jgi:hypothetical protein
MRQTQEISVVRLLLLIFVPTTLVTGTYVVLGMVQTTVPSLLLSYLCATVILFPLEIGIILHASKQEYGKSSLRSAVSGQANLPWWKILLFGSLLFGFAGLMSLTVIASPIITCRYFPHAIA